MLRYIAAVCAAMLAALAALSAVAPAAFASSSTRTPSSPSYNIDLTSDANGRHWSGTEQIHFDNPSSMALSTIWLRLWSNGVRGCGYKAIVVTQVSGGTPGSLSRGCTALPITLSSPVVPGGSGTISMHVAISVPSKNDRFGYHGGLSMLGSVIPTLAIHDGGGWHLERFVDLGESFYSVVGSYHVSFTVPSDLATPSSGVLTDSRNNGNGTETRTFAAYQVRDFEWAAGHLSSVTGSAGGVRVRVSYNPATYSGAAAQGALSFAIRSMNEYSSDFGSYPYPELDVVLSPLPYHGMEYPTFVLSDTRQISIAHEIAHQWWYGVVGNNQFASPFLDESLASWSEQLTGTPDECTSRGHGFPGNAKLSSSMAYWGSHPSQYWVLYETGACMLDAIARNIGQSRLIGALHSYFAATRMDNATPAAFKRAIENAARGAGWNMGSFWQTWRVRG